jgi:hypothetical protein
LWKLIFSACCTARTVDNTVQKMGKLCETTAIPCTTFSTTSEMPVL